MSPTPSSSMGPPPPAAHPPVMPPICAPALTATASPGAPTHNAPATAATTASAGTPTRKPSACPPVATPSPRNNGIAMPPLLPLATAAATAPSVVAPPGVQQASAEAMPNSEKRKTYAVLKAALPPSKKPKDSLLRNCFVITLLKDTLKAFNATKGRAHLTNIYKGVDAVLRVALEESSQIHKKNKRDACQAH